MVLQHKYSRIVNIISGFTFGQGGGAGHGGGGVVGGVDEVGVGEVEEERGSRGKLSRIKFLQEIVLNQLIFLSMPSAECNMILTVLCTMCTFTQSTNKLTLTVSLVTLFPLSPCTKIDFSIHPQASIARLHFLGNINSVSKDISINEILTVEYMCMLSIAHLTRLHSRGGVRRRNEYTTTLILRFLRFGGGG